DGGEQTMPRGAPGRRRSDFGRSSPHASMGAVTGRSRFTKKNSAGNVCRRCAANLTTIRRVGHLRDVVSSNNKQTTSKADPLQQHHKKGGGEAREVIDRNHRYPNANLRVVDADVFLIFPAEKNLPVGGESEKNLKISVSIRGGVIAAP